jgi:tetratricopeptide (TPR) repeat protein
MRSARTLPWFALFVTTAAAAAAAQNKYDGPADEKAQKTYKQALEELRQHRTEFALDSFKKADKQDGGRCSACQLQMIKYGVELQDWKTAELGAQEMVAEAKSPMDVAIAHYQAGIVFFREGMDRRKDEYFSRAHDEAGKAFAAFVNFPECLALDGRVLAYLKQDDAARSQFQQFLKIRTTDARERQRIARYIVRPELARARLAPAFSVSTVDGRQISMDDLQGKVVLLDFGRPGVGRAGRLYRTFATWRKNSRDSRW